MYSFTFKASDSMRLGQILGESKATFDKRSRPDLKRQNSINLHILWPKVYLLSSHNMIQSIINKLTFSNLKEKQKLQSS